MSDNPYEQFSSAPANPYLAFAGQPSEESNPYAKFTKPDDSTSFLGAIGSGLKRSAEAASSGIMGIANFAEKVPDWWTEHVVSHVPFVGEDIARGNERLRQAGEGYQHALESDVANAAPSQSSSPLARGAYGMVTGTARMAPALAASVIDPAIGAGYFGAQGAAEAQQRAAAEGRSPLEQGAAALTGGGLSAMLAGAGGGEAAAGLAGYGKAAATMLGFTGSQQAARLASGVPTSGEEQLEQDVSALGQGALFHGGAQLVGAMAPRSPLAGGTIPRDGTPEDPGNLGPDRSVVPPGIDASGEGLAEAGRPLASPAPLEEPGSAGASAQQVVEPSSANEPPAGLGTLPPEHQYLRDLPQQDLRWIMEQAEDPAAPDEGLARSIEAESFRRATGIYGKVTPNAMDAALAAYHSQHPELQDTVEGLADQVAAIPEVDGQKSPLQPRGIGETPDGPDVDQFVNSSKFSYTDPTGEQRLRDTVARVVRQNGLDPKQVVTWQETRDQAAALGLDDVTQANAKRMSRPELLALRNIVSDNIAEIGVLSQKLGNGELAPTEVGLARSRLAALDAQNMALVDKFSGARSEKGRELNSLKIIAANSRDPLVWLAKAHQLIGPEKMTGEVQQKIVEAAGAGDVGTLARLVDNLSSPTLRERVMGFYKANLLTNPLTHIVNTTSNVAIAGMETVKDLPGAAMDRLMGMATGRRSLGAPSLEQAKHSIQGAVAGLGEAKKILQGVPLEEGLQKIDVRRSLNYGDSPAGRMVAAYVNGVFHALGAEDRVFRASAIRGSLANQARAAGVSVAEATAHPTEAMMTQAITDAEQATFQDATAVGKALTAAQKIGGGAMDLLIPFARTPGAVATRTAEYSPIGLGVGLARGLRVMLDKAGASAAEQREAAKLVGRGVTGSGLIALGMYLQSKGLATGLASRDKSERQMQRSLGKQEASIRNPLTPDNVTEWLSIGRLNPVGNLIAVGATLQEALTKGAPKGEAAKLGAAASARLLLDQPFVQGISQANALLQDPLGVGTSAALPLTAGFIPGSAALGATARGIDPVVRSNDGELGATLMGRIPGLSQSLPPVLDVLGKPLARQGGLTDQLLNPLRRSRETTNPVLLEMAAHGINLPAPDRTLTSRYLRTPANPTGTARLSEDQWRQRQAVEGQQRQALIQRIIEGPGYAKLDAEGKARVLKWAKEKADESGNQLFLSQYLQQQQGAQQ